MGDILEFWLSYMVRIAKFSPENIGDNGIPPFVIDSNYLGMFRQYSIINKLLLFR